MDEFGVLLTLHGDMSWRLFQSLGGYRVYIMILRIDLEVVSMDFPNK